MSDFDQLGLFGKKAKEQNNLNNHGSKSLTLNIKLEDNCTSLVAKKILEDITKEIKSKNNISDVKSTLCEDLPWYERPFLALDVETTGLDFALERVIELALVPFNMDESFASLFAQENPLNPQITNITGINDAMLKGQPRFEEKLSQILSLLKKADFLVAYNAKFDQGFLESELSRCEEVMPDIPFVDPLIFISEFDRFKRGKKLSDAALRWGLSLENAHRASNDAKACGELLLKMKEKIKAQSLEELLKEQKLYYWKNLRSIAEFKAKKSWSM